MSYKLGPRWDNVITWSDFKSETKFGVWNGFCGEVQFIHAEHGALKDLQFCIRKIGQIVVNVQASKYVDQIQISYEIFYSTIEMFRTN